MERLIENIKTDFRSEIESPFKKKISDARGKAEALAVKILNLKTFGEKADKQMLADHEKAVEALAKLEKERDEVIANKIYENAFEWRFEFPEVLNDEGDFVGFDVVIGNPPYGVKFANYEKEFFKNAFRNVHVRTPESYNYFVQQFTVIARKTALCCLIIPSSFLNQAEFEKIRKIILSKYSPFLILNLGDAIFEDVATPTCIIGFDLQNKYKSVKYEDLTAIERRTLPDKIGDLNNSIEVDQLKNNQSFSFIYRPYISILEKCYKNIPTLKDIAEEVATGVSSGLDKAYVFLPNEIQEKKIEESLLKPLVVGGEIHRFLINPISGKKLIYITDENEIEDYPNIKSEILKHKEQLIKRREAANGKIKWYSLNWPRRKKLFDEPKILIRQTANKIMAAYDEDKWYCLKSGIIIQIPSDTKLNYKYLVGLLNSSLMDFLYNDLVNEENRIFPEVKPIQLFKLPIKIAEVSMQNEISNLVDRIITLKKEDNDASVTENKLNKHIFDIYGLTQEEINIVETA
jgi:hypothetical protein